MRNELVQTTTPCQELVASTLRNRRVYLDAKLAQTVYDRLTLDKVLRAPVHIEIVNLLVKSDGISKDTIVGSLHVETEDGTTEGS